MKRLTKLFLLTIAFMVNTPQGHAGDAPNIILILVEGMSRDSIGCYGSGQPTHHIDQLAKSGVRYETVWSMAADTPTVVTLLTGQYPFRHGWTQHYDLPQFGVDGLNAERFVTMARFLNDSGYKTVIGGHWRINDLNRQPDALQQHGFQESCVAVETPTENSGTDTSDATLLINGKTQVVTNQVERVSSFLTDFVQRNHDQPFFIYYPMLIEGFAPNHPETADLKKHRKGKQSKNAAFGIKRIDQLIGNLLEAVKSAGHEENTVILLTGMNATTIRSSQTRDEEALDHVVSDHTLRVPLIVRAPNISSGNRVSPDLIDFTDFLPTVLEFAGLQPEHQPQLDGRSFVPSLLGSEDPFQKRSWIHAQLGKLRMVRDWEHMIDTNNRFHDLLEDPEQQQEINPLDKIAPGRRQRLQMIMDRFPKDAAGPCPQAIQNPGDR